MYTTDVSNPDRSDSRFPPTVRALELCKTDPATARRLAEETILRCRNRLTEAPDFRHWNQELAAALLTVSSCAQRRADYTTALDAALEAQRLYEEMNDTAGAMYSLLAVARAYGASGRFSPAVEPARHSLRLAERLGDGDGRGMALNVLGMLHWNTGDYPRALSLCLQSLDALKAVGNRQETGEVLNNLGLIYTSLGDYDRALEYCIAGLLLKKELGDRLGESRALLNIGNLYMQQEEPSKALDHYRQCLEIQREIGDKSGEMHTLINLATACVDLGDIEGARQYAVPCPDLAAAVGDKRLESYALSVTALIHEKLGRHEMALGLYSEVLGIRRAIGYRQGEVGSLIDIARVLIVLEQCYEACTYLAEALALAESLEARKQVVEVHSLFSEAYECIGDTAQALRHHRQFYALQKEMMSEQAAIRLKNVSVLFEMEQAERQKEIYRLKNVELVAANAEILRQKDNIEQQARIIREANRALLEKNEALERLNREKDELVGMTVHGLKNPLAIIIMATSLLRENYETMDAEELLKTIDWIELTAWRMEETVLKLLRSNSADSAGEFRPELVELSSIVTHVVQEYRSQAEAKDIRIVAETRGRNVTAIADTAMVQEVVDNLVSNAVKFSPAGTTVSVQLCGVDELCRRNGVENGAHGQKRPMVRIAVRDEGPGLSDEDRKRVFGRFERLSAKPTGGEHSTGLGLSIVKSLTERMEGRVWCDSRPGEGATFIVELPSADDPED